MFPLTTSLLDFIHHPNGTTHHASTEAERPYVRGEMQLSVISGDIFTSDTLPSELEQVIANHDELIQRQFLKFDYAQAYDNFQERIHHAYHPQDIVSILHNEHQQLTAVGYARAKVAFMHSPFADGALLNHASLLPHLRQLASTLSKEWMATTETETLLSHVFGLARGTATETGLLANRGQRRRLERQLSRWLLGHEETLEQEFPPSQTTVIYRPLAYSIEQDFSQLENGVIVGRFVIEDPLAYSSVSAMVLHNQVEWAFHHLATALQATQPDYLATIALPSSIPYAVNFASRLFGQSVEVMTYPLGDETGGDFNHGILNGSLYETFHRNRVTCLLIIKPYHTSNG